MSKEEVLSILNKMPLRSDEVRQNIWFLETVSDSPSYNLLSIFNYGYMMGKRDERAKKKALN